MIVERKEVQKRLNKKCRRKQRTVLKDDGKKSKKVRICVFAPGIKKS